MAMTHAARRSRPRRAGARLALVLTLCLAPRSVLADEAPPPQGSMLTASAAQRETARSWVLEGRQLYAEREYERALERFEAAWRLIRVPTTGIEVARTQLALGHWVEANAVAAEVANLPEAANEPAVFQVARAEASELMLGLSPRVPALALEIEPAPSELRIEIDGAAMPTTGRELSFRLNPGQHRLRVSAPGYLTIERELPLAERERRMLSLVLVPEPGGTAVAAPAPALAAAPHAAVSAEPASNDEGSGARTRGHVALAVAGAAALTGSVTGILAFTTKPSCPDDVCDLDQRDEADRSRRVGTVATVSFGAAIALGAYGLWELLFVAPPRSSAGAAAQSRVQPFISPRATGATLELGGAF
jgi:hypothetical protein